MSTIGKKRACIASGFDGRVTFKGRPASGARILRKIHWNKEEDKVEEVYTDEDGRFILSSHWGEYLPLVLLNFAVPQQILVYYEGNEYQILGTSKGNGEEYSEFDGKITNFCCELTDRRIRSVDCKFGFIATTCNWQMAE